MVGREIYVIGLLISLSFNILPDVFDNLKNINSVAMCIKTIPNSLEL